MASSQVNSDKILVRGIPTSLNSDKVIIYFQKRKVGGGDVASVTFPLTSKEPDTAIVTFEDTKTVESVLAKAPHTINGATVTITVYRPEPPIFENVIVTLSDSVMQSIQAKGSGDSSLETALESVGDSTGCHIKMTDDNKYVLQGEWYQVQAAYERFRAMASNVSSQMSSPSPQMAQALIPPPSAKSADEYTDALSYPQPKPGPRQKKEVISTIFDNDIYKYMTLMHGPELGDIREKYKVLFKTKDFDTSVKVEVVPNASDAEPQNAVKALEELGANLQKTVGQDTFEMDPVLSEEKLDEVFASLRPEFPMVHMDRVKSSPEHILFIAPDNERCNMAKEMFKMFYDQKKPDNADREVNVDKDVYDYVKLVKKPNLERIWNQNAVTIFERTVGDCTYVKISAKNPNAKVSVAERDFQNLYSTINQHCIQESLDLSKKQGVANYQIMNALKKVKEKYSDVHLFEMEDRLICFIAHSRDRCENAMNAFREALK